MHAGLEGHLDVLNDRHGLEQADILEGAGDAVGRNIVRGMAHDGLAQQDDIARSGLIYAGQHVENRGFACAVGADQAYDFVVHQVKIDVLGYLQAAEVNAQPLGFKHRQVKVDIVVLGHLGHGDFLLFALGKMLGNRLPGFSYIPGAEFPHAQQRKFRRAQQALGTEDHHQDQHQGVDQHPRVGNLEGQRLVEQAGQIAQVFRQQR